jgi:hypothetical protein
MTGNCAQAQCLKTLTLKDVAACFQQGLFEVAVMIG